jgi:hypothetical protein
MVKLLDSNWTRGIISATLGAGLAMAVGLGVTDLKDRADQSIETTMAEIIKNEYDFEFNEDYWKLKKTDHGLEIARLFKEEFDNENLESYIEFSSKVNSEDVKKLWLLKRIDGTLSDSQFDNYLTLFEHLSLEDLKESLDTKIAIEVNNKPLKEGAYTHLLRRGINIETLADLPYEILDCLSYDSLKGNVPDTIIPYITNSPSRNYNKISDELKVDLEALIFEELLGESEINDPGQGRDFFKRVGADYYEDVLQIGEIKSPLILDQIMSYIVFLREKETMKTISDLIREDLSNNSSELGGIVVEDKEGYKLIPIHPTTQDDNEKYSSPAWTKYTKRLGLLHLHAMESSGNKGYAGPSWPSKNKDNGYSDLQSLSSFNVTNPYDIHCVVTYLGKEKFNVDIYFNDVNETTGKNIPDTTYVLDLGTFEMIDTLTSMSMEIEKEL